MSFDYEPPVQRPSGLPFARYNAYSRFYQPLFLGAVFKVNANISYIQALDTSLNKGLPISELFYGGGINDHRGYFLRSISPTRIGGLRLVPDENVADLILALCSFCCSAKVEMRSKIRSSSPAASPT